MAAVLAASPGAVLSHRSAGALWGILPATPARHEMTVPQSRPSRPGLRFHHSVLASDEITVERGIPVTTVARTLLDIAADMTLARLERGAAEAELRGLGSAVSLETLVARHPHKRGVVAIRALLNSGRIGIAVTRSELEDRFLARVRRAGLPEPRVNAIVGVGPQHIEVDFLWPSAKLAVELDGHATHSTRAAFERDRERDRLLAVAGWRTVRVTWRQLHDDPALVARDLRALLA